MTVELKDLVPGAVVLSNDGKIAIVTDFKSSNTKYPVIYKFKTGTRGFKGDASDFRAILGKVDLTTFLDGDNATKKATTGYDNDALVPAPLKGIKIGDMITIRSRRGTEEVEYLGYNPRRPKNCVSIRMNGKEYKGPLNIVVGKAGTSGKRSEAEIMKDIRNVYCSLSPENLFCDGELPRNQAQAKARRLNAKLKDLFKELGREVDECEAYKEVI